MPSIRLSGPVPGPKSRALLERRARAVPRGLVTNHPIFVERAHGATVTDVDGNTLLDFAGGIGTLAGRGSVTRRGGRAGERGGPDRDHVAEAVSGGGASLIIPPTATCWAR